jgi:deazaflavin-dependent oxidoreductase (nitroreductase family)
MADNAGYNQPIIDEFRANGGAVTHFGRGLVLLHHLGAKSGTERVTPVASWKTAPDAWLIAASKAGAPENPAWYHNLLAHPDITIETPDDGEVAIHVTEVTGADYENAWQEFTSHYPGFLDYQKKTDRTIPVLRLTRRS